MMHIIKLFIQVKEIFPQKNDKKPLIKIGTNNNFFLAEEKTEESLAKINSIMEDCGAYETILDCHCQLIEDYLEFTKNNISAEIYRKKLSELKSKYNYLNRFKNILAILNKKLTENLTLILRYTYTTYIINDYLLVELVIKIHKQLLILDVFHKKINFFDVYHDYHNTHENLEKAFFEYLENSDT